MTNTAKQITIVSYGAGVDSTAVLVGMYKRGERPDRILFANTGGEKPETYHYLFGVMQPWLAEIGFPAVEVAQYTPEKFVNEPYSTLQGNCISNSTMPSIAFGGKGCSQKWKAQPLDRYVDSLPEVKAAYKRGEQVVRVIGYDAGPKDARRGNEKDTAKYSWRFPLRQWGWDRERCEAEIRNAGLPVPMKSACWFCPVNKPEEVRWLMENHPELAMGIIEIERRVAPVQAAQKAKGLWGRGTKGLRKGVEAKPARMTEYLASLGFEPAKRVDFAAIEESALKALVAMGDVPMPVREAKREFVDFVLDDYADEMFDCSSILDSVEPEVEGSLLVALLDERAAA